ncbi:MAG: dihydrofolate reductase [Planctomycetes bacterium]|nr:dihydrofolate reductase [Planctomycetota bacterium]
MRCYLIAAMAENRVIGRDNKLPWHLPDDLQHFKRLTTGHPVVMGRKTFISVGKPLPKRENVILTRNKEFSAPGIVVCHSAEDVAARYPGETEVFICGGEEIYRLFLDRADRIYLTVIHQSFDGDACFPEFDLTQFPEIEARRVEAPIPHTFFTFQRKT